MLKKLIANLDPRVFLTFHTRSLTPLEPNLTEVAWRAKKFRAVAHVKTQLFNDLWVITNFYNDTQVKASFYNRNKSKDSSVSPMVRILFHSGFF